MSKLTESALGHAAAVLACLLVTGGFAIAQAGQGALPDDASLGYPTASAGDNCPPGDPDDPATIGSWLRLDDLTEVMVVHAALLPTGKVLMFAGEVEQNLPHLSIVWDPITNEQTIQGPIDDDLFCAGHAHLADGRLLTMGGDGPIRTQTYVFDPWTETWTKLSDMENGRWYPTGVTLGDGRVVVFSGAGDVGNPDEVEIWDPNTEQWTTYPPSANYHLELYPGMHLMPNGNIFYSGTRWNSGKGWAGANSAYFNPTTGEWQELGPHVNGDRSEAISVLLPELEAGAEPWRVLVAGGWAGGAPQQDTAEIINLADANPQWVNITPMNFRRNNLNAAILPDGDVAMVSGISGWKWGPFVATLTTEHFDPLTETWQAMASMQVGAQYHSIGLLLPDGRVLKTGGHLGGIEIIHDMEVYSPAYLFNGPRPIIDAAPAEIGWAEEFSITTPNAQDVTLVSLVKLGQITHHTNPDQRFLSLNFQQVGEDLLMITSPAHGNIAPPGYYMLFILNDCGVPSESAMVRVGEVEIVCVADLDDSGDVGVSDLLALLGSWGPCPPKANCPADFDGSGNVGVSDFLVLLANWGPCP